MGRRATGALIVGAFLGALLPGCSSREREFRVSSDAPFEQVVLEPNAVVRAVPRSTSDGLSTWGRARKPTVVHEHEAEPGAPALDAGDGHVLAPEAFATKVGGHLPTLPSGVVVVPGGAGPSIAVTVPGWPTGDLDAVGWTLIAPRATRFRLTFVTEQAGTLAHHAIEAESAAHGLKEREVLFAMSEHPAWRGELRSLRLELLNGPSPFWFGALRAYRSEVEAYGPGAGAPLVEQGRELGEGAAERELRRSLPAYAGEDQFFVVGGALKSRVMLGYGLPQRAERLDGPVRFEVAVAVPMRPWKSGSPAPSEWRTEPQVVFVDELHSARDAGRWFDHAFDLPTSPTGQSVLWLRTTGGRESGVNGLWSQPLLLAESSTRPPSVLFISADTLRADRLGVWGYEKARTPNIDRLAAAGTRFRDCFSVANSTSPSHASLLTGLYPKDHRVINNRSLLGQSLMTLAEMHPDRVCIAATAVRHLNASLSGLAQGMDVVQETPPVQYRAGTGEIALREGERLGADVNSQFIGALERLEDASFFAWVHYFDPHTPYQNAGEGAHGEASSFLDQLARQRAQQDPAFAAGAADHAEIAHRFEEEYPALDFTATCPDAAAATQLYDDEIAELDRQIGELIDALQRLGRWEDTWIVFTADHGEGLGERDVWFAHRGLFDNTLHVPLIVRGPDIPAGVVIEDPVSTIDLYPTVCALTGRTPPESVRGRSLLPRIQGAAAESHERWFEHSQQFEAGFRTPQRHVVLSFDDHERGVFGEIVAAGTLEVFDVTAEGLEPAEVSADEALGLRNRIEAWRSERLRVEAARAAPLSAEDRANLEALGYGDGSE